ncbi:MAG: exosortase/archaeosortase family protein [Phycisphaerales bacterium]
MTGRLASIGWTPWRMVALAVLAAAAVVAALPAWRDIALIASLDEEASHIYLVPIVAAWMVWARRLRVRFCAPAGEMIGPPIVVLGWLAYVYGYNNAVQFLWHGGAVLVLIGCVLSVLGKNALFRFFPAFAVLVFLVPVPGVIRQQIALPLQTATAATTQALLETMGIAVDRSGNLLSINGHEVAVAEACNGMRMVFALVLVSYAFAYSMPLRHSVRVLVLLASPLAAIFCNVLRLLPTVWLYGYQSQPVADKFHDLSGWIMLPLAFLLLLGVVRLLRWALIPVAKFNLAYQ